VNEIQRKSGKKFAFFGLAATNSEGASPVCRRKAVVVVKTRSEKQKISWNEPFFVIILQCQKEQTTFRKTEKKQINTLLTTTLKNYNYEEEFSYGKVSAHEHDYRRCICVWFRFLQQRGRHGK
jgi:hypothetical protein